MSALVIIGVQIGIVLTGFVATSKVIDWYHSDTKSSGLGGKSSRRSKRSDRDDFFSSF